MKQPESEMNEVAAHTDNDELAACLADDLPLTDEQAEAAKGGIVGGSNANIANYPHQLSLR